MAVMPALQEMVAGFREIIPIVGPQLKAAIESVDWQAFAKSVVDLTTFLITHAETIAKVVAPLFILNTAFNVGKVAVGLYNAAAVILGNTFVVTAGKIALTTAATRTLGIAMKALPWVAVAAGAYQVGNAVDTSSKQWDKYRSILESSEENLSSFEVEMGLFVLHAADWLAALSPLNEWFRDFMHSLAGIPKEITTTIKVNVDESAVRNSQLDQYLGFLGGRAAQASAGTTSTMKTPTPTPQGAGSVSSDPTGLRAWTATNAKEAKISAKEVRLIAKGLSADVARSLVGTNTPIKTANAAIRRINKNGTKAIANLTKSYQNSAAGQQAAAAQASAAAEAASQAAAAAAQAAAEQARQEAAILAEKQRVYEAFAYSVTSTFGRIKDAIMGAFSLPELGGSTDSIIRNMDKLLARVKSFSANITKLSNMGLDPKLLQQVINAGPIAGAKLASNLVAGGAGALATINRGFADIGNLASEIGTTGTQATFGTQAQQQIYNVTINGGLDSGPSIGKAVVDAIKAYERTSGVVFQGA
jgi:hypothetical protein